jgi:hypothetical protein
MADFSTNNPVPSITSNYVDVLSIINNKLTDLALGLDPSSTDILNPPTGTIRWSTGASRWQKWTGSTWSELSTLYGINISGNAATASTLATARTIGGVSFNGSANINLPGVNIPGNQSTTGNAATATTAGRLNTSSWQVSETSGTLYFLYNGEERMSLDSNGNLKVTGFIESLGDI